MEYLGKFLDRKSTNLMAHFILVASSLWLSGFAFLEAAIFPASADNSLVLAEETQFVPFKMAFRPFW
jgi:hypothetical protein